MTKTYYKAFDKNFQCQGFQYEVGKTYNIEGPIKSCEHGFHACEYPLDVLNYYDLCDDIHFSEVTIEGDVQVSTNKICSSGITIKTELSLEDLIKASVDWHFNGEDDSNLAASGYDSKLAASGYDSNLAASGSYNKLAASGSYSKLAASGYDSKLAASGSYSNLAASGSYSNLAASGSYSKLAASGSYSKLAASGYDSKLAASGSYSNLAASGSYSKLAASGYDSNLAASGSYSKLAASGYDSKLAASGCNSIVSGMGEENKVQGTNGTLVSLVFYKNGTPKKFVTGVIGKNKLKPDTWYGLSDDGKFKEVK